MSDYWFRPKTHGYGASPSNWKGWAATIGFVVVSLALTMPFLVMPALKGEQPSILGIVTYALLLFLSVGVFIWLCKAKTDGEWKWRWGE